MNKMKNFLFLGFAIPDEEMQKVFLVDQFPTIQTHKFNWNFIKAIEHIDLHKFIYISAKAVSDYPFYPIKRVDKKKWLTILNGKGIEICEIPFFNQSLLKVISRFICGLFCCIKNFHSIKNKGGIIVYSVHVPFMLIGFIISIVYKIDYIGIWTDPPSVINARDSYLKNKLRKLELLLSIALMKKATKAIVATKYLAEEYLRSPNYLVVDGIIDVNEINTTIKRKNESNILKIVYTGTLDRKYGIENIVKGFLKSENKNLILEIYGRGDFQSDLEFICMSNLNILYKGFISNQEILHIQREADFLINARDPNDSYVKYTFPSKTLEYMLSGTPLISTFLLGMSDEYKQHILIMEDNTIETISKMIHKVSSMSIDERYRFGVDAQRFALSRSYQTQGLRIIDFITND